jgi:hypothetical protein
VEKRFLKKEDKRIKRRKARSSNSRPSNGLGITTGTKQKVLHLYTFLRLNARPEEIKNRIN